MLLGNLGASLLGNVLTGKGIVRAGTGNRSLISSTSYGNKKAKVIVRAGTGNRSLNCSTSYENKKEWYF